MKLIVTLIVTSVLLIVLIALSISAFAVNSSTEIEWIDYNYDNSPLLTGNVIDVSETLITDKELSYTFNIDKSSDYKIMIRYMPINATGSMIGLDVKLDDKETGNGKSKNLFRIWRGGDKPERSNNGNEMRSAQREIGYYVNSEIRDSDSNILIIHLQAGEHIVTLSNCDDEVNISQISFVNVETSDYQSYKESIDGNEKPQGFIQIRQAENMYQKSDTAIYTTFDRTSPYSQPYHPTQMRLNTIGGSGSWYEQGQWASWEFDILENGWYNIGIRYRQNTAKGFFSARELKIDGKVPFKEMQDLRFTYSDSWKNIFLGDNEPYSVYLQKGKHTVSFEVTLGSLLETVNRMKQSLYDLNEVYRKILMITGPSFDIMRDYELFKAIPDLKENLTQLSIAMNEHYNDLQHLAGNSQLALGILPELLYQLEEFSKNDYQIPSKLSSFSGNLQAFADWLFDISNQPLELDYVYITSTDIKPEKADTNLFGKIKHEFTSFIGSFTQNYDSMDTDSVTDKNVRVWINLGRDQSFVIRRLIDEQFTPTTGISVKLEVVQGALLKATTANRAPDVNLFTKRGEIMNLAFRDAVLQINDLPGFNDLKNNYMPTAFVPYEFNGNTYAIPTSQTFFMMFIRDDIFDEMGLKAPQTWEDLEDIAPTLQSKYLEVGLPYSNLDAYSLMGNGIGTLNLLPTLLTQMGANIYTDDFRGTTLNDSIAQTAFKKWTGYYTDYGYTLYKDNFNRFRSGEMPLIIDEYGLYNRLMGSAPEITGNWSMYTIPGIKQADGSINNSSNANGTGDIILKDCKDTASAWEFLKWWQSAEIQSAFSKDLEDQISIMGRYLPANVKALELSYWSKSDKETLLAQWEKVVELPEVPGGFYLIRNLDNAFREVYYQNTNPVESLYKWNKSTNREILEKRRELGLY